MWGWMSLPWAVDGSIVTGGDAGSVLPAKFCFQEVRWMVQTGIKNGKSLNT